MSGSMHLRSKTEKHNHRPGKGVRKRTPLFTMAKTCAACGERKRVSSYYFQKTSSDGYAHKCKPCALKYIQWQRVVTKEWMRTKPPTSLRDFWRARAIPNARDVPLPRWVSFLPKSDEDSSPIRFRPSLSGPLR